MHAVPISQLRHVLVLLDIALIEAIGGFAFEYLERFGTSVESKSNQHDGGSANDADQNDDVV